MSAMGMIFIMILITMISIGIAIYWVAMQFVKIHRAHRWVESHDGVLIGSDEFFAWCDKVGMDPSYFF